MAYRLTAQQRAAASDARTLSDLELIVAHIKQTRLIVDSFNNKHREPDDRCLLPITERAMYERAKQFQ